MGIYALRRVVAMIPVMLLVGIIAFLIVQFTPGDPASFFIGEDPAPGELEAIRARLGLDQPVFVQFVLWFGNVLRGDLGMSFHRSEPVLDIFLRRLPPSVYLTLVAITLAIVVALPLGILAAVKQNTWIDKLVTVFVLIGVAMPNFWLGMLLIMYFSLQLGWLPVQGFVHPRDGVLQSLRYLILPGIALGFSGAALIARMTRSAMLEVLKQDYVRTARAKGLSERVVIYGHALRNSFLDILTVIGITVVSLISGNIIVELVFNFPGIGRLVVDSIQRRDYPVIQGSLLLIAGMVIIVNLIVDLLYGFADPRIRYE